jgi:hypothetical protein
LNEIKDALTEYLKEDEWTFYSHQHQAKLKAG